MAGVFAEWQPQYAEHGIATFPVRHKKPAVANYLKIGLPASRQLVERFSDADMFGFACRSNGITVLDVDSSDEELLADALSEFGESPFIVRSGSGHFQAWYRNSGERRGVRPDRSRPIDILGDGYVVAPPSKGTKGSYRIIRGSLDDLAALPTMRHRKVAVSGQTLPGRLGAGVRNDTLWRECMKWVSACSDETELVRRAIDFNNSRFDEPLPPEEVLKIVRSASLKDAAGENWFGRGAKVVVSHNEIDDLMQYHPDAFTLLMKLRRHHWSRTFVVANAMANTMPPHGWTTKRFAAARRYLETADFIESVRPACKQHGPALYRLKGSQK